MNVLNVKRGSKTAHSGGRPIPDPRPRTVVQLQCGCETGKPPPVSNPSRWWCCGAWQHAR